MNNVKFTTLSPAYVMKSVQCIMDGYYSQSPNWKALNPKREASQEFFTSRLCDERVHNTSVIAIDESTDDVVGVFCCTDITLMKDVTLAENRQKDVRIQAMSEINYSIFKPLKDLIKQPGVCMTGTFYTVRDRYASQKLG